ncbi:MAG: hypothetical protein K2W95_11600 [Candidatus Obscuribacterales bacterium]|nr:hypothetical protein [Candidatus Obscuribacterales bacterium]
MNESPPDSIVDTGNDISANLTIVALTTLGKQGPVGALTGLCLPSPLTCALPFS